MEVEGLVHHYIYPDAELDRKEGTEIIDLISRSQQPIPDPDEWLARKQKEPGHYDLMPGDYEVKTKDLAGRLRFP